MSLRGMKVLRPFEATADLSPNLSWYIFCEWNIN